MRIDIEGHPFLANLTLLPSDGLDVILGMDWLTLHKGVISCSPRYVEFTHPQGHVIRCEPNHGKTVSVLCALEARSVEEVPIMCEYPNVFLEELPGMPSDLDVEFVIDLLPGTGPIAKRPYRMSVNELRSLRSSSGSYPRRGTSSRVRPLGDLLYCSWRRKTVL